MSEAQSKKSLQQQQPKKSLQTTNLNGTRPRRTRGSIYVAPPPQQEDNTPTAVCYRCRDVVKPVEDRYPTWKTHTVAVCCFLIGIPFLVFIPYCFDCFGAEVLRCPKCGCYINILSPEEDNDDDDDDS